MAAAVGDRDVAQDAVSSARAFEVPADALLDAELVALAEEDLRLEALDALAARGCAEGQQQRCAADDAQRARTQKLTFGALRSAGASSSKYSFLAKPNRLATRLLGNASQAVFRSRTTAL